MRLLWLPTVLRAAGLTVHEVSGWKTRGRDTFGPVRGITCHHTGGSRTSTDQGELNVLVNGRGSPGDANYLPGPISQLYLSRTGHWWVVASGTANHNKIGWAGPNEGYGNDSLLGVEAQHAGSGEPWTEVQYRSYVRGVAALVRHKLAGYDVAVTRVAGHKEHQPGDKSDPSFDMNRFRADVTAEMEDDMSATAERQIAELHAAFIGSKHEWAQGRNAARLLVDIAYAFLYGLPGTETTWLARTLTALGQAAGLDAAELEQIRGAVSTELAAELVAALRVELADLPAEAVEAATERAVRRVLGSLDTTN